MYGRKPTRLLGLSILAIVAVMAMSASTAQASYNLVGGIQDKSGTLLLSLDLQFLLSEFLLEYLSTHFHCQGGTGSLFLQTNSAMTVLTGSGTARLTGCVVQGWEESCTVKTPGSPAGELLAAFEGTATMGGGQTYMNMASEELVVWEYNGEECPFAEVIGVVSGSFKLAITSSETSVSTHLGGFDDIQLFYGEEPLAIHGTELASAVVTHATKVGGGNWAIQLQGL